MKTYQKQGYEYFYDKHQRHWVVYPIDADGNRVEWDINDNPIEAMYFLNKGDLDCFFNFYVNHKTT
jgi:hypothetical protein